MSKRFMGPGSLYEVALSFDDRSARLATLAKTIAARTGSKVRLAHAIEPFAHLMPRALIEKGGLLADVGEAVDESRELEAGARLKEVAATFGPKIPTETLVTLGNAADTVMADAMLHQAGLIMVGAGLRSYKLMYRGFSTALRLAVESRLPVMVVGAECPRDLTGERLRVMVADDLTPACEEAVYTAFDLARALGRCDLLHVHVNSLTDEALEEAIGRARRVNISTPPTLPEAGEITRLTHEHLLASLKRRAPERLPLLEARGGSCRQEVLTGEVVPEIERAARAFDADIVVYGRHQMVHHRPFGLGRVSWHEMLTQERIVVIAPARP